MSLSLPGDLITVDGLAGDPFPYVADLRARAPVTWSPALNRWLVSRRDLILAVLDDVEHFTTDHHRSPIQATFGRQMLSTDGVEQLRHRRPFTRDFRPRTLRADVGDAVRSRAEGIVAALGPGDDLTQPTSAMAIGTVLDVLRLSGLASLEVVAAWYDDLATALANVADDPAVAASGRRAVAEFRTAMVERATSGWYPSEPAERGLDGDELVSNTLLVLFGGIETTQSAMLNALWALAVHRDAQTAVRDDRTRLAAAVEESLRWEPAVLTLTRYTTCRVELGGVSIPADSIVECLITGANRDPATFVDPDRYDPGRANAGDHLTFGHGRHYCLGAHLARMEALALIGALLDRASNGFTFAESEPPGPYGHEFRRPPRLHLTW